MANIIKQIELLQPLSMIGKVFGGELITPAAPELLLADFDLLDDRVPASSDDRKNLLSDRRLVGADLKKVVEEKKKELASL